MFRSTVLAILVSVQFGCASVRIEPIRAGSDAEGLRFYRPLPYLLVSVAEAGKDTLKLNHQIVWLPDYSSGYAIRPSGWLGSASVKATLENGWQLTELGVERDVQVAETLAQVPGLITSLGGAAARVAPDLGPGLYRFKYDDLGQLVGLEKVPLLKSD